MAEITLKQFVELNKVDREVAYGLFKFLREMRVLKISGTVLRPEGAKGRPEIIFSGDPAEIKAAFARLKFE
jgi:hypothetical protein